MTAQSIIFVCTGNTCRSPMAEAVARRHWNWVQQPLEISSAGLQTVEGAPASGHSIQIIREWGGQLQDHRSHLLDAEDVRRAMLIVGMTRAHCDEIIRRFPDAADRTRTLSGLVSEDGQGDIADPYGGNRQDYQEAFGQIEKWIREAADRIRHWPARQSH